MQKRMTAKYSGIDSRTGYPINKGDRVIYDTDTRKIWVDDDEDGYRERTRHGYISDVYNVGGKEYYRNKSGLCIDAPCCGCCTV
jgi:hypothetical protein